MSQEVIWLPLPFLSSNRENVAILPKTTMGINSNYTQIPSATNVSLNGFKIYSNIISVHDTSLDDRITQIIMSVLGYIEVKTGLSIFTTQWISKFSTMYLSNFELTRLYATGTPTIQYKGSDYFETGILATIPSTFVYNNTTLPTYTIEQNANRQPIIVLNPNYKLDNLKYTEDNVSITFNTNVFAFPPDLQQAVYIHGMSIFNGEACEHVPMSARSIYQNYFSNAGTQRAFGMSII